MLPVQGILKAPRLKSRPATVPPFGLSEARKLPKRRESQDSRADKKLPLPSCLRLVCAVSLGNKAGDTCNAFLVDILHAARKDEIRYLKNPVGQYRHQCR